MKKAAPAVLGTLVLLLVTACGSNADSEENAKIATNVAKAVSTESGILNDDEAACVAKKFVDELGAKKLKAAKVVTSDGSYNENGANVDATTSAVYAEALLSCVDKDEAIDKIQQLLVAGSSGAAIPAANAKCYVAKLVKTVDIEHLLSSRIITDSGELSENAAAPDKDTAAKSTDALLACADYYALDAKERASQTKGLNPAKYQKCLKARLSKDLLAEFLTAVQAQTADVRELGDKVNKETAACVKSATKK